jgi:hypothetical protein
MLPMRIAVVQIPPQAKCAALAPEADDPEEREHYARLRDAWITLAKRCEPFDFRAVQGAARKNRGSTRPGRPHMVAYSLQN